MAILKVAHLGNPVLRKIAAKVDPAALAAPDMQRFLDDMVDTMREYDGIGLAAPQVHVSQQIAVIEGRLLGDDPKLPDLARDLLFIVNPVVQVRSERSVAGDEGCLSVPGLRGKVMRAREVDVEAFDRHGRMQRFTATGWFARVIQHEVDHLGGKVYLDRMKDLTTLTYLKEYRHFRDKESDDLDEPMV